MFGNQRKKLHKLGQISLRFSRHLGDNLRSTFEYSFKIGLPQAAKHLELSTPLGVWKSPTSISTITSKYLPNTPAGNQLMFHNKICIVCLDFMLLFPVCSTVCRFLGKSFKTVKSRTSHASFPVSVVFLGNPCDPSRHVHI